VLFSMSQHLSESLSLPLKGDVTNWAEAGGSLDQLNELVVAVSPLVHAPQVADPIRPIPINGSKSQDERPKVDIDFLPSIHSFDTNGIKFAIGGLIAMSAVTMLAGDAGAGKTTFATAVGAHVATGEPFVGRNCEQRKVLILDRENTLPVAQERLTPLHIQDGGNFKLWGSWNSEEAPQPAAAVVMEWVQRCDPKPLVIIDSMIAFLNGDGNDATAVRAFMQQMRDLSSLGAAVVVLHHTGKAETAKDYRGSSDIKASIDVGLTLMNLGERRLERIRLRTFKERFAIDANLILDYDDGQFSIDDRPDAVNRSITEQLTELLRANPGCR
jgi:archaellum biogenesis ATPase FlaH